MPRIAVQLFIYLLWQACSCGAPSALAAGMPRDPAEAFFQESFGDFHEELATARAEGKQGVLLFFEQEDCPFCYRMKTTILNQPVVQDYYRERFRIFSVDIEGDLEITDFQGRHMTQKDFALSNMPVTGAADHD